MPARNHDLHGNVPDSCPVALLLIDVINDLEFPGGRELAKTAVREARRVAALKHQARRTGIPVIYANDNFGRWRSNYGEVVEHCLHDDVRGRPLAEMLTPEREDYFVLKPKHSAFFSTTLATLLEVTESQAPCARRTRRRRVRAVHRGRCLHARFRAVRAVGLRCIEVDRIENRRALAYMARVLHADTRASARLNVAALARRTGAQRGRKETRRSR